MRVNWAEVRYWVALLAIGVPLTFGFVFLLAQCAQPIPLG